MDLKTVIETKIKKFYLIDLVVFSLLLTISELIGHLLLSFNPIVTLSYLILLIFLFRWKRKIWPLLIVATAIRIVIFLLGMSTVSDDDKVGLILLILISIAYTIPLLILLPLFKVKAISPNRWSGFIFLAGWYILFMIIGAVAMLICGHYLEEVLLLGYYYNLSYLVSLILIIVLMGQKNLFIYMPDYFTKEIRFDESTNP